MAISVENREIFPPLCI